MQSENFELRQELKKLQLKVNSLQVDNRKPRSKGSSRASSENPSEADPEAEIAKCGRKYSLIVCPWIDASVFDGLEG